MLKALFKTHLRRLFCCFQGATSYSLFLLHRRGYALIFINSNQEISRFFAGVVFPWEFMSSAIIILRG